jgi:hypothetical protein
MAGFALSPPGIENAYIPRGPGAIGVHPTKTCPRALPHLINTINLSTTAYYDRLPNSHLSYIVPPGIVYIPN